MKINFFLNVLSIHQAPLIRKLSEIYTINIFYDELLSKERKELGWYTPSFGSAKVCAIKDINEKKLLKEMSEDTVNIFSGLYAYPEIQEWLDKSIKTSASNYIQMESLILNGVKGQLRRIKYKLLALKYNKKIDGVLSQGGKAQLESIGFKNVHDFAYFLDKNESVYERKNQRTNFIYVGAISKRKRILELVSSIGTVGNYKLDIYGSELDVPVDDLESAINNLDNIKYKGVIKNDIILQTIKKYDYLILPSKAEGWGAVVAEALLCGVGVIVTDVAGIVSYLENHFSYGIYIEDFSDMGRVVKLMEVLSPLEVSERKKIQNEAYCLSSEYGAKTLNLYISQ